jgi:putative transposase
MCRVYRVTRGGYYAWRRRSKSSHSLQDERLVLRIRRIFERSRGTYGSPRVWRALQQRGVFVGQKRVARLMRGHGLRARAVKIYRRIPGVHRHFTNVPNRARHKSAQAPNQVWVGDITYLRQGARWRYLAVVMDKCSRRIIGWALGAKKDADLTLRALNHAVRYRRPSRGLIFHSDRGSEYAALTFRRRLTELGFIQSMNRPRRMTDNACMESFFHSLKSDVYHRVRFTSESLLTHAIRRYLPFYNQERLHSALGFLSPVQYEMTLW